MYFIVGFMILHKNASHLQVTNTLFSIVGLSDTRADRRLAIRRVRRERMRRERCHCRRVRWLLHTCIKYWLFTVSFHAEIIFVSIKSWRYGPVLRVAGSIPAQNKYSYSKS